MQRLLMWSRVQGRSPLAAAATPETVHELLCHGADLTDRDDQVLLHVIKTQFTLPASMSHPHMSMRPWLPPHMHTHTHTHMCIHLQITWPGKIVIICVCVHAGQHTTTYSSCPRSLGRCQSIDGTWCKSTHNQPQGDMQIWLCSCIC